MATSVPVSMPTAPHIAYIDPMLLEVASFAPMKTAAVIVSSTDSQTAAKAVKHVGGQVNSELWLIDAVAADIPMARLDRLAAAPDILSIFQDRVVEVAADVEPTEDPFVWDVLNPVTIDIGAEVVHGAQSSSGIRGRGIGVAVVDSGIHFHGNGQLLLGPNVSAQFLGQVDFTGPGVCADTGPGYTQYSGYCATDSTSSTDDYGHGSHVATTILNEFKDINTGVNLGIAPGAKVLSVRVLDDKGIGSYKDVIEGIQHVVAKKDQLNIRVMNLSLVADANTPYFVDPINRAAEAAWAAGIVVVAAAGNRGPDAQSITVPGNDPYVITVGAIDSNRTPGDWSDDMLTVFSATGPTLDGFVKPDLLAPGANVVAYMYNDVDDSKDPYLVKNHPENDNSKILFRMSGTSMATAVTSGVVALILEKHPTLTPDQVKFRLMASARASLTPSADPVYNPFQQGSGRLWAPDAVLGNLPADRANTALDIDAELANPWVSGENCSGLVREAEEGQLFGDFEIGTGTNASGGQYVHVPDNGGYQSSSTMDNRVEYCFTVTTSDFYLLQGWIHAPNETSNSYYVRVNGNPAQGYLWDTEVNSGYQSTYITDRHLGEAVEVYLTAGRHQVSIAQREDGLQLDKLALVPRSTVGSVQMAALPADDDYGDEGYYDANSQRANAHNNDGVNSSNVATSQTIDYYLQNYPIPPTEDTNSQAILPLTDTAATVSTLYNYDKDRDAFPGRLIQMGASGEYENDLAKIQRWQLSSQSADLQLAGNASLTLYTAMKDFDQSQMGSLRAYIINQNSGEIIVIADKQATWSSWGNDWTAITFDFGTLNHVIPVGHLLELALIVDANSEDDMWLAYGTASHPSHLTLDIVPPGQTPTATELDTDDDGIPDAIEDATAYNNGDSDGDGTPDREDIDSEGDGIPDLHESGLPLSVVLALDSDGDGVIDSSNSFGQNGLADAVETAPDSGELNYAVADRDGDDTPDFQAQAHHFAGPVQRLTSDDGQVYLYYVKNLDTGELGALGAARTSDMELDQACFPTKYEPHL